MPRTKTTGIRRVPVHDKEADSRDKGEVSFGRASTTRFESREPLKIGGSKSSQRSKSNTKQALLPGNNAVKRTSKTLRRFRSRPGVVALREIKKLQRSTDLLIPRLPF